MHNALYHNASKIGNNKASYAVARYVCSYSCLLMVKVWYNYVDTYYKKYNNSINKKYIHWKT